MVDAVLAGEPVGDVLTVYLGDAVAAKKAATAISAVRKAKLADVHAFAALLGALPEGFEMAVLADACVVLGNEPDEARVAAATARLLADFGDLLMSPNPAEGWAALVASPAAAAALRINTHEGVRYVHQESADALIEALLEAFVARGTKAQRKRIAANVEALRVALVAAGYRADDWVAALGA